MRPKSAFELAGSETTDATATVEADPPAPSRSSAATVYLHPGQIFASSEPKVVSTILGSCVAVCLWDGTRRLGGMNHYLLPYGTGQGPSGNRYGNLAMERLLKKLTDLGARKSTLEAKLFGGACVIEAFRGRDSHLGAKNERVARQFLSDEGIPVVSEDVGGRQGRKLIFHLDDGTVWMKHL